MSVAYDPNNPTIQSFLSSLSLGEAGNQPTLNLGYGGVDLSGNATDAYGFPIWSGSSGTAGATHAAGPFQFQPNTWDAIASQYGLNFQNPTDQQAGAWYEAQQVDPNLYAQLSAGDYTSVQSALGSIWPSVNGSGSSPQGLAAALKAGIGAILPGGAGAGNPNTGATSSQLSTASNNQSLGFLGGIADVEQFFLRFGLIIIGAVVVIVALWQLLSEHTALPSPKDAAHGAALALA
jgi:muramidase (phage lysozyme)